MRATLPGSQFQLMIPRQDGRRRDQQELETHEYLVISNLSQTSTFRNNSGNSLRELASRTIQAKEVLSGNAMQRQGREDWWWRAPATRSGNSDGGRVAASKRAVEGLADDLALNIGDLTSCVLESEVPTFVVVCGGSAAARAELR